MKILVLILGLLFIQSCSCQKSQYVETEDSANHSEVQTDQLKANIEVKEESKTVDSIKVPEASSTSQTQLSGGDNTKAILNENDPNFKSNTPKYDDENVDHRSVPNNIIDPVEQPQVQEGL